jgi:hypothetical protein
MGGEQMEPGSQEGLLVPSPATHDILNGTHSVKLGLTSVRPLGEALKSSNSSTDRMAFDHYRLILPQEHTIRMNL